MIQNGNLKKKNSIALRSSTDDAKVAGEKWKSLFNRKKMHHFTQNLMLILEYVIPFENYHGQKNGLINACPFCNFEISYFAKMSTASIDMKR